MYLGRLKKTTENFSQHNRYPGRDLNQAPPEYVSRTLPPRHPLGSTYEGKKCQVFSSKYPMEKNHLEELNLDGMKIVQRILEE
jgi:hypothetical protein